MTDSEINTMLKLAFENIESKEAYLQKCDEYLQTCDEKEKLRAFNCTTILMRNRYPTFFVKFKLKIDKIFQFYF